MCGRFTRNYTWEQIHALYRLTALAAIPNLQPRFNACPTDPADTIVEHDGMRAVLSLSATAIFLASALTAIEKVRSAGLRTRNSSVPV
jgi:putative SOS response-associated peptidase YedK